MAKTKFEETYKTLEESYKAKLDVAKETIDMAKNEIEELEEKIEELAEKPFVNVSESDMEHAEATLVEELEAKYERAFDLGKEKFNRTFEIIQEANAIVIERMEEAMNAAENRVLILEAKVEELLDVDVSKLFAKTSFVSDKVNGAVRSTERRMRAESDERINTLKENLVMSTEIFLEQELSEVKADKKEIMKETQGRELLESIKGLVKQYWDVDSEVAEEILEMKKIAEAKVVQYRDMLKKEHSRLEESQAEVETLKKRVIVESRGSVLTSDKKQALAKLAEDIGSDKLETKIDDLMESVINTFNAGFSKQEVINAAGKEKTKGKVITESSDAVTTTISSGDTKKGNNTSDELAELLAFAGVRR
jgi:exonuclease VII large subunit